MAKSKYKHKRGHYEKRGHWYYGNTKKLSLKQIRAIGYRKHHKGK